MADDRVDDIEAALFAQHNAQAPAAAPRQDEATRRATLERRGLDIKDGRSAKYMGRTVQLNLRVRPETKELLLRASLTHEASMTYIVESAIAAWVAAQDRKRGGRT